MSYSCISSNIRERELHHAWKHINKIFQTLISLQNKCVVYSSIITFYDCKMYILSFFSILSDGDTRSESNTKLANNTEIDQSLEGYIRDHVGNSICSADDMAAGGSPQAAMDVIVPETTCRRTEDIATGAILTPNLEEAGIHELLEEAQDELLNGNTYRAKKLADEVYVKIPSVDIEVEKLQMYEECLVLYTEV